MQVARGFCTVGAEPRLDPASTAYEWPLGRRATPTDRVLSNSDRTGNEAVVWADCGDLVAVVGS
jgi:hypothetical protein